MDARRFEQLVAEALDDLPETFQRHLENVEVVIEEWPTAEDLEELGMEPHERGELLGLYLGIPLTERDTHYFGVLPDRIALYRGSILAFTGDDPQAVREEVRHTVIHEVAHFYGISDERLEKMGWD